MYTAQYHLLFAFVACAFEVLTESATSIYSPIFVSFFSVWLSAFLSGGFTWYDLTRVKYEYVTINVI